MLTPLTKAILTWFQKGEKTGEFLVTLDFTKHMQNFCSVLSSIYVLEARRFIRRGWIFFQACLHLNQHLHIIPRLLLNLLESHSALFDSRRQSTLSHRTIKSWEILFHNEEKEPFFLLWRKPSSSSSG